MVCVDNTVMTINVGSEVLHYPNDTQPFELGDAIVLLVLLQSPTGKGYRSHCSITLSLRQHGTESHTGSVGLKEEFLLEVRVG